MSTASNICLKMKIEIHRDFCPYRIDCPPCCFCLLLFSPDVNALFRIKLALISAQLWLSSPFLLCDFWTNSTIAGVEVEKEPSSTFRRWQFPTFISMDLSTYPTKDCSLWPLLLYVFETFLSLRMFLQHVPSTFMHSCANCSMKRCWRSLPSRTYIVGLACNTGTDIWFSTTGATHPSSSPDPGVTQSAWC